MINLIKNLFKIVKVLSSEETGNFTFVRVSASGKQQKALLFSPYGLMHRPPENSMGCVWLQNGQESNSIAMVDDPNNRILKNLEEGEVALGNYMTGSYILFNSDGGCEIVANSLTHNGVNISKNHVHGGVEVGGGNTGGPS